MCKSRVFTQLSLLGLILLALALGACGDEKKPAAKFAMTSRVRLQSSSPGIALYASCNGSFGGLNGVANNDDEAVILRREFCNHKWWYKVQVTALKNEDWQGIGWLAEADLKTK